MQTFQKFYEHCPLMQKEAKVVYTTIFLPTITYPFPATTLSTSNLEQAQSMTTPMIISHMGYNQNMPKLVIYAPLMHRGLCLKHLHTEQGLQKALQFIKHLQTQTTLGKLMQTMIKAYQIQAGLLNSILKDTQLLPWLPHQWISNLREFLHSTDGSITLENLWTIPKLCQHDTHIMHDFLQANLSPKDLQTLNNCQMYLQVTTLAEIAIHDGAQILPNALQ